MKNHGECSSVAAARDVEVPDEIRSFSRQWPPIRSVWLASHKSASRRTARASMRKRLGVFQIFRLGSRERAFNRIQDREGQPKLAERNLPNLRMRGLASRPSVSAALFRDRSG